MRCINNFPMKNIRNQTKVREMTLSNLRILMVGCGGLGNEVLKNLILLNFKYVDIVDPDIVEKSNLHRQFFFTDKDIGRKKAEVMKEKVERKFHDVTITCHVKRIEYLDNSFFEMFDIIIGCLDNIEARIYINNVVFNLKKDVVYIDGGVEGFKGNIKIIKKNSDSACINCSLYNYASQNIPACSIIGKPKNPIECILYAANNVSSKQKQMKRNKEDVSSINKAEKTKTETLAGTDTTLDAANMDSYDVSESYRSREIPSNTHKQRVQEYVEVGAKRDGEQNETDQMKESGSREYEQDHEVGSEVDSEVDREVESKTKINTEKKKEKVHIEKTNGQKEKNGEREREKEKEKRQIVEDESRDSTNNYIYQVYMEAKKSAKEFQISNVTYQLTKEVLDKTVPTFCSTLMIIGSLMVKEVRKIAEVLCSNDPNITVGATITNSKGLIATDHNVDDYNGEDNDSSECEGDSSDSESDSSDNGNSACGDDYGDILYVGDCGYYLHYYKMSKLPNCLICNKTYIKLSFKKTDTFKSLVNFLLEKYDAKNCSISSTSCIIYMSTGIFKNVYEHKLHLTFHELIERGELVEEIGLNALTEKSNDVIFINFY